MTINIPEDSHLQVNRVARRSLGEPGAGRRVHRVGAGMLRCPGRIRYRGYLRELHQRANGRRVVRLPRELRPPRRTEKQVRPREPVSTEPEPHANDLTSSRSGRRELMDEVSWALTEHSETGHLPAIGR